MPDWRSACNFFMSGASFTDPVRLYEIVDGQAREIVYDPAMFEFDKAGIDPKLMQGHVGFAGFRVQFVTNWKADVAAFLGASYFRAVGGDTRQYGLSARALGRRHCFSASGGVPALHVILVRDGRRRIRAL